jgi:hypothetical protein
VGTPDVPPLPPRRRDRVAYLVAAAAAAAVLAAARFVTPATSGVGTHEQLGLPPCTFHVVTGHGCPGCGLTTAFAHLSRGAVDAALAANPMALPLFSLTALSVPWLLYRAARPVPIERYVETPLALLAIALLTAAMYAAWLVRLVLGMV